MKDLNDLLEEVKDESTFLVFVEALISDRKPHEGKPTDRSGFTADWANNSISGFLEGAVSWAEDSNFGVSQEPEIKTNTWKQFAAFLYCGKIYE